MLQIDEGSNGQDVELTEGDTLEITLPENPTTGYRWSFESNGEPVCVLIDSSFEPSSGPPGAGGRHRWRFRATAPGQARIALAYRRPWAQAESPAKTFAVQVRVSSK